MAPKLDIRLLMDRLSHLSFDLQTFQKYAWMVHLLIIFLLAKSVSNIFVHYLDHRIQEPVTQAPSQRPTLPVLTQPAYPAREEFKNITRRNIFNPNAKEEEIATPIAKGTGVLDEAGAVPSTLPLELVGTIILTDPKRSVSAIKDKGQNRVESYQVGDVILGKAKVFKIEAAKVYFQNTDTGGLEFIQSKVDEKSTGSGFATAAPTDIGGGIRQMGEDRFIIDRGALEASLANPNDILTQARAVPNVVDGRIQGFRIFSIRPGSIYEKLGIRNGDVILAVNGIALDSPAKALEFYGAISSASEINLDTEREGLKHSKTYVIK